MEYALCRRRYSLRTREVLPPNDARLKALLETMGERVNRRPAEKGVNDEEEKGTAQHLYAYVKVVRQVLRSLRRANKERK